MPLVDVMKETGMMIKEKEMGMKDTLMEMSTEACFTKEKHMEKARTLGQMGNLIKEIGTEV